MKELKKIKIFLIASGLFTELKIKSQCAMCKAVVESNLESGDDIGSGLNDGILNVNLMFVILLHFYFLKKTKTKSGF